MHRSRYRISLAEELVLRHKVSCQLDIILMPVWKWEGEDENLNCVVKIVRQAKTEDGCYFYGCEFVGMASVFDYIFEDIEKDMGIMRKLFGKQEEIFYSKRAILDRKQNA